MGHRIFVKRLPLSRSEPLPWKGRCTCGTRIGGATIGHVLRWVGEHRALSDTLVLEGSQEDAHNQP